MIINSARMNAAVHVSFQMSVLRCFQIHGRGGIAGSVVIIFLAF